MSKQVGFTGTKQLFVVVGAAVAVGLLCGHWLARREGIPRANTGAAAAPVEDTDLANQVARLEAVLGRTEQRLQELEARQPGGPGPAASLRVGPETLGQPPGVDMAELQARETAKVAQMDQLLVTEPRDRSWAAAEEDQLRHSAQLAGGDGGAYSINSLSCRTSICKMEVSNRSLSGQQSFMREILHYHPDMAAIQLSPPEARPDGSYVSAIRIIRTGHEIPTGE